ncbi:MAG: hypothetical protein WD894_12820 [Pirellulales bacterium]
MPKFRAKSTKAVSAHEALVGIVLFILCGPSVLSAESLTVTLTPAQQTGAHGTYFSAPFDFGTAFSEIESVRLEFVMPGGYEGYAASTGNSFYSRALALVIHDAEMPITSVWSLDIATALSASVHDVRPGESTQWDFRRSFAPGEVVPSPNWPDFLFQGAGRIEWIDVFDSSVRPQLGEAPTTITTTWLPPGEIQSAQLTIVGTPVPEPASALLVAMGALTLLSCRQLRRSRSLAAFAASRR